MTPELALQLTRQAQADALDAIIDTLIAANNTTQAKQYITASLIRYGSLQTRLDDDRRIEVTALDGDVASYCPGFPHEHPDPTVRLSDGEIARLYGHAWARAERMAQPAGLRGTQSYSDGFRGRTNKITRNADGSPVRGMR